ncbi:MAG: hypothetical protein V7731_19705 [Amphritea sp.]
MMRPIRLSILFLAALLMDTPTGYADTVLTGVTDAGAHYRIVVPDLWNGDLVIWNHGFSLSPIGPLDDQASLAGLGPLAPLQLTQGYAVAASSYQHTGWALFKTSNDLRHLVNIFKENVAPPNQVLVNGASMGGLVTAQSVETANIDNLVGAYPVCGLVAGSRNVDMFMDLRLVYEVVCAEIPGAFIPGGAMGLPVDSPFTDEDIAIAANACTGILIPEALRTPGQQTRLAKILNEVSIPETFLLPDLVRATFGIHDLLHKMHGIPGVGNEGVSYNDPTIDNIVQRIVPNPGAENRLKTHFTPTGGVGDIKIIALHTDKDGLVIVENEKAYAEVVPASNLTTAIVVEAVPSHCGFTEAEVVAGWEALRTWVAGGPQPTAASIQGICTFLEGTGFGGPCRIDPSFVIPDMDGRIHPR